MSSPTINLGGVAVAIYLGEDGGEGAIKEAMSLQDGGSASVRFQCPWSQRYTVFKALCGTSIAVGTSVLRTVPFAYPPSPNLWCLEISDVEGVQASTDASGWVQYQKCRFTAHFRRPPWDFSTNSPFGSNDPSGQPWTTTKGKASAQVITPPGGSLYFTAGVQSGQPVEEASVGVIQPQVELQMTRHWIPFTPLDFVLQHLGNVNQDPVTIGDHTFAKGCLLFGGIDWTDTADTLGNKVFEWTYTLLGLDHDWNAYLDRGLQFNLVNSKADASGSYPFPYSSYYASLP